MDKKTNNGLQNTTEKTYDLATLTPRKTGGALACLVVPAPQGTPVMRCLELFVIDNQDSFFKICMLDIWGKCRNDDSITEMLVEIHHNYHKQH